METDWTFQNPMTNRKTQWEFPLWQKTHTPFMTISKWEE